MDVAKKPEIVKCYAENNLEEKYSIDVKQTGVPGKIVEGFNYVNVSTEITIIAIAA